MPYYSFHHSATLSLCLLLNEMVYKYINIDMNSPIVTPFSSLVPSTPMFLPKYHYGHYFILLPKQLLLLSRTAFPSSPCGPEYTEVVCQVWFIILKSKS